MTLSARNVLNDCREVIEEISGGVQGSQWRIRWVAAVVLLRTVGYVLSSVDKNINESYRQAIDEAWSKLKSTKPEPKIFWEFIDAERNNIIHEYKVGAGQGVTVYLGQNRDSDNHYLINTGQYKGRNQRDVLLEAIQWWESYLDEIEQSTSK